MSVLLTKILHYSLDDKEGSNYTNPSNITDAISFDAQRGLDIKNNTLSLSLKNRAFRLDSNAKLVHRYVSPTTFETVFQEDDQVTVYARYTDDMSVVEASEWQDNSEEPSSTYLLGSFFITDFNLRHGVNGQNIEILCVDKTAVLFNRLLAKNFDLETTSGTTDGTTSGKLVDSGSSFTQTVELGMRVTNTTDSTVTIVTGVDSDSTISLKDDIFVSGEDYKIENSAPSVLLKVIRFVTEKQGGIKQGTGNDAGVNYDVGAATQNADTNSGYIQDVRRATTEDGSTNTDLAFPAISLAKVWKPVYEWIGELSDIEFINDAQELDGTDPIVYGQSFIYWIDENNDFHWVEKTSTVDTNIDVDVDENVYSLSLNKSVFGTANIIVFRGGEDLYGSGTLDYNVDATAGAKNLRMRVIAMTDIAQKLIEDEIARGNLIEDNSTPGEFTFSGNRYTNDTYGFTTSWGVDTTGFSDDDYNNSLKDRIIEVAKNRSRNIMNAISGQRFKGSMEIKGEIITPGTLYSITDTDTGIVNEKIRVVNVQHNFTTEGWFTTLELEQDEDAIIGET